MQHVCVILSSVVCRALQRFPVLSHKRYDFRKQITENKLCVLILSTTWYEEFLILTRNERDMIKNCTSIII